MKINFLPLKMRKGKRRNEGAYEKYFTGESNTENDYGGNKKWI